MVNKDQLEQSEEGRQVLSLMADNFSAEEFQPALTLIEQLYTEEQAIWDAGLNHESKWPFVKTNAAQRIVVFFEHPEHVERVKDELKQRQVEAEMHHMEVPVVKIELVRRPARSSAKTQKPKKKKAKPATKKKAGPAKKKTVKAVKKTKRVRAKKKATVRRKPASKSRARKPAKKRRR